MPSNSTASKPTRPAKPRPDYPLFAHATGRWAKKIKGRIVYFGPWQDPAGAEQRYRAFLAGETPAKPARRVVSKPKKPYPDFPLFAHSSGRWAKKIRGKLHYFGRWEDWQGALARYKEQADDLHAGLKPRAKVEGLQLRDLVNRFLTAKLELVKTGELRQGTFNEYHRVCDRMLRFFGRDRLVSDIQPEDFARLRVHLAQGLGLGELGKRIGIVRSCFKFGVENRLITHAVVFGSGFRKPSQKALRRERKAAPSRMLEPAELRALIDAAGVPMRAMILLGLNCGFGNTDIAELPLQTDGPEPVIDLTNGWIRFPRPKTGELRKAPLWPETIAALEAAIAERRQPRNPADAHRLFITTFGDAWVRHQPSKKHPPNLEQGDPGKWSWIDSVNLEFRKLLRRLDLKRKGVSFYSLRHVFRTIADEVNDRPAIDAIMGHAPEADDMGPRYVERIDEQRLRNVTEHVRRWVFALPKRQRSPQLKIVKAVG